MAKLLPIGRRFKHTDIQTADHAGVHILQGQNFQIRVGIFVFDFCLFLFFGGMRRQKMKEGAFCMLFLAGFGDLQMIHL